MISLDDSEAIKNNVEGTLIKYKKIDADRVINKAQFLSFMADLSAMAKDSTHVKEYLQEAIKLDSIGVYNNLLAPIHSYLVKARPDRKTMVSPILDYELDYIIELFERFGLKIPERKGVKEDKAKYFYWACYIRVRDQWYRVPQREANWEIQTKIDIENQMLFDHIFTNTEYPKEDYFKWFLQVLLLHSDTTDWTYKWLNVYLDVYENDKQTLPFLRHFNRRSYVADNLEIREVVLDYEDSHKNLN